MSAGNLAYICIKSLFKIIAGLIGWLIVFPLSYLIPVNRKWFAVIGRDDGKFLDNAKYFFLQTGPLLPASARLVYVTERRDVVELLDKTGYESLIYPSWSGLWFLLRAGILVVDSSEWVVKWKRFLLAGSKKVQLWHGVGFKRIELDKWKNEAPKSVASYLTGFYMLRALIYQLTGRLVRYDLVTTTSVFYRDQVFKKALLGKHFAITGYPRNTFGELKGPAKLLAWRNIDQNIAGKLAEWQRLGHRVVLFTPTFRDARGSSLDLSNAVCSMLESWCRNNQVELVFKFHPLEEKVLLNNHEYLHICDPDSDIYPLMPISSALITDYSSIYMDYLLLDKPVLFFVPDIDEYVRKDRQLQFDYADMTPGPKLQNWQDLLVALSKQLMQDTYESERSRLKVLAFDGHDQHQSVPKLIQFMASRGWMGNTGRTRC